MKNVREYVEDTNLPEVYILKTGPVEADNLASK